MDSMAVAEKEFKGVAVCRDRMTAGVALAGAGLPKKRGQRPGKIIVRSFYREFSPSFAGLTGMMVPWA
ncbi:MAG: hypothetical protein C7B45_05410 [Sulfobacillus acidophilus]|uniref:Uncharacterized protein n=1 Tax=Sulfobacillus acidophilus TaxID=53633 RepID=A0A2T2WKK2_9FIRM|nr:MAG: hypothetical protein C7B45_05410 [Sulfobacillus acidophilus]